MKVYLQVNSISNHILFIRYAVAGVAATINKLVDPDKAPGGRLVAVGDIYHKLLRMHSGEYAFLSNLAVLNGTQLQVQPIIVFHRFRVYYTLPVEADADGIFLNIFLDVD